MNHNKMNNITFSTIPKPALEKSKPKPTDRIEKFVSYYSKESQHKDFLKIMGLKKEQFSYHNTRICSAHKRVEVEKTMTVQRMVRGAIINKKIKFKYEVPDTSGIKSTLTKNKQSLTRKTTARERRSLSEWSQCYEKIKEKSGEEQAEIFSQLATSFQQIIEDQTPQNPPLQMKRDTIPFFPH